MCYIFWMTQEMTTCLGGAIRNMGDVVRRQNPACREFVNQLLVATHLHGLSKLINYRSSN